VILKKIQRLREQLGAQVDLPLNSSPDEEEVDDEDEGESLVDLLRASAGRPGSSGTSDRAKRTVFVESLEEGTATGCDPIT
jgi:hypothetical protein